MSTLMQNLGKQHRMEKSNRRSSRHLGKEPRMEKSKRTEWKNPPYVRSKRHASLGTRLLQLAPRLQGQPVPKKILPTDSPQLDPDPLQNKLLGGKLLEANTGVLAFATLTLWF
ncbi:hypothetical protein Bbelb_140410 [Branchiostoma belcheri]|nr:hypothetical protein Bbelb_140410 [Branchiostoma belcheri]